MCFWVIEPCAEPWQSILDAYGLEYTPDGQYIRWSVSNKKHPRNWNMPQKIYDSSVIIFLDLFTDFVVTRKNM